MSQAHNLENYTPPPDTGLSVIYVDDCLLVVDKPSGLLSVPGVARARTIA
jgi:tRNA pseudouridine32 synthase/23S rRNA pseudouridine746 synthase